MNEGLFPPPWNINEHPEKTEGWLEFQRAMKNDPNYYNLKNMGTPKYMGEKVD